MYQLADQRQALLFVVAPSADRAKIQTNSTDVFNFTKNTAII